MLSITIQSFISLVRTTVLWLAFGYSMSLGPTLGGISGNPTTYARRDSGDDVRRQQCRNTADCGYRLPDDVRDHREEAYTSELECFGGTFSSLRGAIWQDRLMGRATLPLIKRTKPSGRKSR
jgi:ammonia channel protein AmtB